MDNRCVAVLGRPDAPTDAVEEYCRYLAGALATQGTSLEITRARWAETGWSAALRELSDNFSAETKSWFLLQYTALAWSRRGFSWRFLRVIRHLQKRGGRCAVVFHDADSYSGTRVVDRARRIVQLHTLRQALKLADLAIFTIPPAKIPWITAPSEKTVFIPVGANLPSPETAWQKTDASKRSTPMIAVFCVSGGDAGVREITAIADAALVASQRIGPLQILVLGRNSEIAGTQLQVRLGAAPIEVIAYGVVPGEQVAQLLCSCDAMLFVRGPLSTRRGSAIAGISCGLPVIAGQGWETAPPVTEAGVVFVESEENNNFGVALIRVLEDRAFQMLLAARSRQAYTRYFSWQVIASQFAEAMRDGDARP